MHLAGKDVDNPKRTLGLVWLVLLTTRHPPQGVKLSSLSAWKAAYKIQQRQRYTRIELRGNFRCLCSQLGNTSVKYFYPPFANFPY